MKGQNILVIGASSGIGAAVADLIKQAGGNLYTAGRSPLNGNHMTFDANAMEVGIPEDWPDTFHGLVYCPGTINLKPFTRLTQSDFLADYQINVLGFVGVLQAFLPRLKKASGSSVVVFSTVAAQIGLGFHASIAAAKGALQSMALSLASELVSAQIRVNVVAPSLTQTPLAAGLLSTPEKAEASARRHPIQRVGTPADMAKAAMFFLEPNGWITGQTIVVDGGMSKLK